MTAYRKPRRKRPLVPVRPEGLISSTTRPLIDAMVGDGRRKELLERARDRLPLRRHQQLNYTGWTVSEYQSHRALPSGSPRPPQRVGRATAELVNRLSGVLPADAVPLARSIIDAAPPAGERVNPALRDVLERYLPETLNAFNTGGPKELRHPAERLLLDQLALLRQATTNLLRAQAEHNDRDLQIQEAFLRERFADLTPSGLDLPTATARSAAPPRQTPPAPARDAGIPSWAPGAGSRPLTLRPIRGRVHVHPDHEPVVLMAFPVGGDRRLGFRLALPKGQLATLGIVCETIRGAIGFEHTTNRRFFSPRHPTGFRSPQVDVNLRFSTADIRRFMIYAASTPKVTPTTTVLFIRDGNRSQADLPTMLTNDAEAGLTVVCSGYAARDGLVLRNESVLYPDLRSACNGFGFDQVEWLDQHTPIV